MNSFRRLVSVALIGIAATPALAAQEPTGIPEAALLELLRHVAQAEPPRSAPSRQLALITEKFPDQGILARAAESAGFAKVYETRTEILRCSNSNPSTCEFEPGDQFAALSMFYEITGDGIVARVVLNTFVRKESGEARLIPVLHEITLRRGQRGWQVTSDQVLMRG